MLIPSEFYASRPMRQYYSYAEYVHNTKSPSIDGYELMTKQYAEDLVEFYRVEDLLKPIFAAIPHELWKMMVELHVKYRKLAPVSSAPVENSTREDAASYIRRKYGI